MCRTSPEFSRLGPFRIRCFPLIKEELLKGKYFRRDDSVAVAIQAVLNYHGEFVAVTRMAVAIQAVRKHDTSRLHERVAVR